MTQQLGAMVLTCCTAKCCEPVSSRGDRETADGRMGERRAVEVWRTADRRWRMADGRTADGRAVEWRSGRMGGPRRDGRVASSGVEGGPWMAASASGVPRHGRHRVWCLVQPSGRPAGRQGESERAGESETRVGVGVRLAASGLRRGRVAACECVMLLLVWCLPPGREAEQRSLGISYMGWASVVMDGSWSWPYCSHPELENTVTKRDHPD
uniref:Transposable element activator uncharacterized 23 kDa protein n=1 Tax=Zea mays TaxID=4577 RepID=YAC9_MAIZE|nr:RecName: Full=Transposable element activator uncharacterized 23 kDa protein; Short=AC 23 kDa protein [Zea mays]